MSSSEATILPTMPTTSIQDAEDFQARLNNLPRELFDVIEDLTFSAHITMHQGEFMFAPRRCRDAHVANLKILQLSRATRARHAEQLYHNINFVYYDTTGSMRSSVFGWLNSVAVEHRALIGKVRLHCCPPLRTVKDDLIAHFGTTLADKVELVPLTHWAVLLEDDDFPS